jgi:hypothetical protein
MIPFLKEIEEITKNGLPFGVTLAWLLKGD